MKKTALPYGRYRTTGTYSGTFYDPARAQLASNLAAARTENQINNISENSQARLNNLQDMILKRTTVFPGMDHGGSLTAGGEIVR